VDGIREEGPLSGATLVAYVNRPGFDGQVTYDNLDPGLANQTGGSDVEVFAPGMRNPFDIVQHTNGHLYGTDNGANSYYADGMRIDCETVGPDVNIPDEIDLIERGGYYGHPNSNRARFDPRQCRFRSPLDPPGPDHAAPILAVTSSTDGILEYRADNWDGMLRGDLISARMDAQIWRTTLAPDGRSVTSHAAPFPMFGCLDLAQHPDGTIYGTRIGLGEVTFMAPVDPGPPSGPRILSMWPERGPVAGGRPARLHGSRLEGAQQVRIGGLNAPISGSGAGWVEVTVPASAAPGPATAWVQTSEGTDDLAAAYIYVGVQHADGDDEAPALDIAEAERRYFDLAPPAFTLHAHDRLGLDSVLVRLDGNPWAVLGAGLADTSLQALVTPSAQAFAALAPGLHTYTIRVRDDAGNVTTDGWSWHKGLPPSGITRVNCGGPGYTSTVGYTFGQDWGYKTGAPFATSLPIAGTPDPALYQDARVGAPSGEPLSYLLPVASRVYAVRLHFAEIDTARACPGCRVFDVVANGDVVLKAFEPSASGAFTGVTRTVEALVENGQLDIAFTPSQHEPIVSAVEVWPLGLDDAVAPAIADIPEPSGVTFDTPPVLTLSASDPADGELWGLEYDVDGMGWRACGPPVREPGVWERWTFPLADFVDLSPGFHTLRVRALDLALHADTTAAWVFGRSAIVAVGPDGRPGPSLAVHPNPARGGAIIVRFAQPDAGESSVRVFDLAGRLVHERDLGWRIAGAGEAALEVDATRLQPGLYFVRFEGPRTLETVRLAIVR
jgi:hypothetical protein